MGRWGLYFIFLLANAVFLQESSFSQDFAIIGRICPADSSNYPLQDGKSCNPDDNEAKACDQKYKAPSDQWRACHAEIRACFDGVSKYNEKISKYNAWMSECRRGDVRKTADRPIPPARQAPQQGSGGSSSDSISSRLDRQTSRNGNVEKRDAESKAAIQLDVAKDAKEIEAKREAKRQAEIKALNDAKTQHDANKKKILDDLKREQQQTNAAAGGRADQIEEVYRASQQLREANFIPPGWIRCDCPGIHSSFGKIVRGARYHPPHVGGCD